MEGLVVRVFVAWRMVIVISEMLKVVCFSMVVQTVVFLVDKKRELALVKVGVNSILNGTARSKSFLSSQSAWMRSAKPSQTELS